MSKKLIIAISASVVVLGVAAALVITNCECGEDNE